MLCEEMALKTLTLTKNRGIIIAANVGMCVYSARYVGGNECE